MNDDHVIQFWQTISLALLGVLTTIAAFWFGIMRHLVKKQDIIELIELHSPYLQERDSIMTKLELTRECQTNFAQALQKNTQVMSELKTQLAVLSKTLEHLEKRMDKEQDHE